ncbi:cupin domain-containing protein [Nocardioides sp. MAH-18]|uniref:Cupin domain-containing protein n=1 Tax=Nocardioides agri TaxID=2682843 RepID=A0A6L6XN98_9ACTN|nr:cupin domain-containing protein [Nocardioides sp. CGMCC 1.13656]MVQ48066.1 cupin domain-containing protein [Nocardioides sp. MAH-18]
MAGASGLDGWSVVDASTAAVHTGFGISRLAAGGSVPAHVHSYEESLYVLDGEVVVQTPGEAARLGPGGYGLVPVAVPHSLRNDSAGPARFARMSAPMPRPAYDLDTQLVPEVPHTDPLTADVRDPRTRRYGHIDPSNMDPAMQTQDKLAVSASMRTALLVYSGITVKMMVDSDLGAVLSTMFMVQYEPDGLAGPHDHPFEETYLILEGAVEATFDGTAYVLEAGDVAWAGAGAVHGFRNVGDGPVRWLETQAPQPPGRHSYRFARDWDYLRDRLGGQ